MTEKREQRLKIPHYPFAERKRDYGVYLPYIFISYCHEDVEIITSVVKEMYDQQYRIWHDDGIDGGDQWWKTVKAAIENAAIVVLFLSTNYLSEDHPVCKDEMNYALDNEKEIIPIRLDEVDLKNEKLKRLVDNYTQLTKAGHRSSTELLDILRKEHFFEKCKRCRYYEGITEKELESHYAGLRRPGKEFSVFDEDTVYPVDYIQLTGSFAYSDETVRLFDVIKNWQNDEQDVFNSNHEVLILRSANGFGSTSLGKALEQSCARGIQNADFVEEGERFRHQIVYQDVSDFTSWGENIFSLKIPKNKYLLSGTLDSGIIYLDGIDGMLDHTDPSMTDIDKLEDLIKKILLLKREYKSHAKIVLSTSVDYGSDDDLENNLHLIDNGSQQDICRVLSINELNCDSLDECSDLAEGVKERLKQMYENYGTIRGLLSLPYTFSWIRKIAVEKQNESIKNKSIEPLEAFLKTPESICSEILDRISAGIPDADAGFKEIAQEEFVNHGDSCRDEIRSFAYRCKGICKVKDGIVSFLHKPFSQYYLAKRIIELIEKSGKNIANEDESLKMLISILSHEDLSEFVNTGTSSEEDYKDSATQGGTLNWISTFYGLRSDKEKRELHECLNKTYCILQIEDESDNYREIYAKYDKYKHQEILVKNLLRISRACCHVLSFEQTRCSLGILKYQVSGINLPFLCFADDLGSALEVSEVNLEGIVTGPGSKLKRLQLDENVFVKHLYFNNTELERSQFDGAIIEEAYFLDSKLFKVGFQDTKFISIYFVNTEIENCDFRKSDLLHAVFVETRGDRYTRFDGTKMNGKPFDGTILDDFLSF